MNKEDGQPIEGQKEASAMAKSIHGSCVCGTVSYEVSEPFRDFYLCHCHRCQKTTGSAHATNLFSELSSITWLSGTDSIKNFDLPEAEFFNHSFCSNCGSPVPRRARSGEFLIIPAGSLDAAPEKMPERIIFWDSRAEWYDEGCSSKKFSEYPD